MQTVQTQHSVTGPPAISSHNQSGIISPKHDSKLWELTSRERDIFSWVTWKARISSVSMCLVCSSASNLSSTFLSISSRRSIFSFKTQNTQK